MREDPEMNRGTSVGLYLRVVVTDLQKNRVRIFVAFDVGSPKGWVEEIVDLYDLNKLNDKSEWSCCSMHKYHVV